MLVAAQEDLLRTCWLVKRSPCSSCCRQGAAWQRGVGGSSEARRRRGVARMRGEAATADSATLRASAEAGRSAGLAAGGLSTAAPGLAVAAGL